MHGALILQGCVAMVFGALVFVLRAKQVRREMDETMMRNDNTMLGTAALAGFCVEHLGVGEMVQNASGTKQEVEICNGHTQ